MSRRPAFRGGGRPSFTLRVAGAATFLVLLVFNAVLPTVGDTVRSLSSGVGGQTWALGAMSLGLAAGLLPIGALADRVGRRRVLQVGSALMAAGGVAAATAPDMPVFVAARIVQGAAGAGVVASSLALIGVAFPTGPARTAAMGVWGAMVGGGIAVGPIVAALLAAPFGWRSTYWCESAATIVLLVAAFGLDESRGANPPGRDATGGLVLAAGMGAVTAGLIQGRSDWTSPTTLLLLAGGSLLLATFPAVEARRRDPILDPALLRRRIFLASIAGALTTGVALIGLMSLVPTLLQRGLGLSILGSSAVLGVWSGTSMVVALQARRLPAALDTRTRLALALVVCALGELGLAWTSADGSWLRLVPGLLVAGVGSGVGNAALGRLAVEAVPPDLAGMGSGANNSARYLGAAAGVAAIVAVIAAASGSSDAAGFVAGWNVAAVCAGLLCLLGAGLVALCRDPSPRARAARAPAAGSGGGGGR